MSGIEARHERDLVVDFIQRLKLLHLLSSHASYTKYNQLHVGSFMTVINTASNVF